MNTNTSRVMASMRALRWPRGWLALWAVMLLLVVVLSLVIVPPLPEVTHGDKYGHALAYASLAAMAVQLFSGRPTLIRIGLLLIAYGVAMEFLQGFTPNRTPDPLDALANSVGVLIGMSVAFTPLRNTLVWIEQRLTRANAR
ncbi:MAG: VanZ family protein [Lysobacteraceae bacterium]